MTLEEKPSSSPQAVADVGAEEIGALRLEQAQKEAEQVRCPGNGTNNTLRGFSPPFRELSPGRFQIRTPKITLWWTPAAGSGSIGLCSAVLAINALTPSFPPGCWSRRSGKSWRLRLTLLQARSTRHMCRRSCRWRFSRSSRTHP